MDLMEPWDPLDHPPRIEIRRQDSDDSDAEGGLGNVTRVVLRPPGHSGKAKRGHLSFDASFETGNLGRVDFISEFEYDLFLRPDTCNPRHRFWFNFVVDNVRTDQRVIFNIVNFSKPKNLFSSGMTPLVKTSSRPKWQRMGGKYVYYHKSPEHRNHYILSFAFVFDREDDVYQFALTFPYSYSRLNLHLTFLLHKNLPWLTVQTLANSLQNRKVQVYTICNRVLLDKKPKAVVVMARIHPGESPTSYVAQGLIDFLISTHPLAGILRDHVLIKVIPMVNPDGVFLGNHRTSLMGYDLNRHWNQILPLAHPVLQALKNYFQELDRDKTLELDMIFDLHAHTSLLGTFIYGNSYEDVYRFERHILFPKLLAHNAEDYNPTYTMYNRDPHKGGAARRHLCDTLRTAVNIYTIQVSVYAYTTQINGMPHTVPYTEEGYFRLGRNLGRTIAEYYRVTGIIPVKIFSAAMPAGAEIDDETKRKRLVRRSRSRSRPRTHKKDKSGEVIEDEDLAKRILELGKVTDQTNLVSSPDGTDGDDSDDEDSDLFSHPESPNQETDDLYNTTGHLEDYVKKEGLKSSHFKKCQLEYPGRLTFRTFDFSVLTTEGGQGSTSLEFPCTKGRKVGGGGVVGKEIKCRRSRKASSRSKWFLETGGELTSPSLTIIDFNQLIRMGVEQRRFELRPVRKSAQNHGEQKGRRRKELPRNKLVTKEGRRSRTTKVKGQELDGSGWEESSDSDCERQFVLNYAKNSSSQQPLLHDSRSFVQHERMQLNPRQRRQRTHVQFV